MTTHDDGEGGNSSSSRCSSSNLPPASGPPRQAGERRSGCVERPQVDIPAILARRENSLDESRVPGPVDRAEPHLCGSTRTASAGSGSRARGSASREPSAAASRRRVSSGVAYPLARFRGVDGRLRPRRANGSRTNPSTGRAGRLSPAIAAGPLAVAVSVESRPVHDAQHLMPPRRSLLQSARRRFGRENLRATIHRPVAGYALARQVERVRALRADGVPVGVERVPSVTVINLKARTERFSSFMDQMDRLGIENVRRFEGISETIGAIGCTRSHAALVREMIDGAWPCMMVCEDDVRFRVSREKLDVLVDAFLNDESAEVACLEFNAQKTRRYSSLFLRATESQNAGCYLIKAAIAPALLEAFEEGVSAMSDGGDPLLYNVDIVWKPLQKSRVFLVPIERIAYQEPGYSDIERRFVDRVS